MLIVFDGTKYDTDIPQQWEALINAITSCTDAWKLEQAIGPLRFQVFSQPVAQKVLSCMEQRGQQLQAPRIQLQQGVVFNDSRPRCTRCKQRVLEPSQYSTGHDWFSNSTFDAFICGYCANHERSSIKPCGADGCGRLYWATTSFTVCADCFITKKYKDLATNQPVTLTTQLDTPQFHAGVQAETLFRNFIKRETDLDSITVSSNNGIDLVFITRDNEEYDALKKYLSPPPLVVVQDPPQRTLRKRKEVVVERGVVIHYMEVKVNDAQCSKAQSNAQAFVEDRLKNALNGQYGVPAQQGARTIERAMRKGADFEFHLIRVSMPRNGTWEYQQGNPITATCHPWGESGGLGSQPVVILPKCNSITYMDSAWIGDTGERIAQDFLKQLGFDVRGAVQNNTGNGVDLAARLRCTPTSPRWAFFEVKASTVKFQTKLEAPEGEQWMFVMDRCTKALLGIDKYKGLYGGTQVHATTWTVNELFWDFQSEEDWTKRALYFQVAVRLPDAGTKDAVQVKLLFWPGPRSQGTTPLKKDPIPTPLFVNYSNTSGSTTFSVPKVSVQTLAPHPFGGRYDNQHSCFVMNCVCRQFVPVFGDTTQCKDCGHPHGA